MLALIRLDPNDQTPRGDEKDPITFDCIARPGDLRSRDAGTGCHNVFAIGGCLKKERLERGEKVRGILVVGG